MATAGAEEALAALSRSLAAGRIGRGDPAEPPSINLLRVRTSAERIAGVMKRLETVLQELYALDEDEDHDNAEEYLFYQLFFPEVPR